VALKIPYIYDFVINLCRQQSYRIMKVYMFGTLGKAKFNTENIKGSNLVAVRHTTVQVSVIIYLGSI